MQNIIPPSAAASCGLLFYRVGQKSKLLILCKYVNKTEKIGGMWTNTNIYRENGAVSDNFTWNMLCHNYVLWLNEITARQTRTSLRKHDVIKVCSIEYLKPQIELMLPTFKSWTVHNKIFNVRTTISPLKYLSRYNSLLFWPTLYNLLLLRSSRSRVGWSMKAFANLLSTNKTKQTPNLYAPAACEDRVQLWTHAKTNEYRMNTNKTAGNSRVSKRSKILLKCKFSLNI